MQAAPAKIIVGGELFTVGRQKLDPTRIGGFAADLKAELSASVVGQPAAVDAIVDVLQEYKSGLTEPGRPIANIFFTGPTGTGKTHVVEVLAEFLTKNRRGFTKIDCAEFQHSHDIAKLIGSPPGYLGHRETHPALSQEAINKYQTEKNQISILLFDEIEKASNALWRLMLGIMDKAEMTLGDNRRVDFSKVLLFMTSNAGAKEYDQTKPGFTTQSEASRDNAFIAAMRRQFDPEFVNRIDKTVVFNPLTKEDIEKIVSLEMKGVIRRMIDAVTPPFLLVPTDRLNAHLVDVGMDKRYGARNVRRSIRNEVSKPVTRLISSGQIQRGDHVEADYVDGRVEFSRIGEVAPLEGDTVADVRSELREIA